MRNTWIYLILALVIIGLVIAAGSVEQPGPNFDPSFSKYHQRPYGSSVVYEMMGDIFSGDFKLANEPTYNIFSDSIYEEQTLYAVINTRYEPDMFDIDYLTDFVSEGNYALIASHYFSEALEDTLGGLTVEPVFYFNQSQDSLSPQFSSPSLNPDTSGAYDFERTNMRGFFKTTPDNAVVLASLPYLNDSTTLNPILVYIPYGEGGFLVSSSPYLFTNYEILNADNQDFLAKTFSYVPEDVNVLWDEYYKVESMATRSQSRSTGGLYSYIRSQPGLSSAWTLFLLGLLFYVISEVKRKQRLVPIIKPHPNATLEFTQTIGQLYYSREDHKAIATKKVKVWLEYVRSHYYLKTAHLDRDFIEKLAAKSGVEEPVVKSIVNMIGRLNNQDSITESLLIDLSVLIESFYEKSAR
jgi:hypothetical protein